MNTNTNITETANAIINVYKEHHADSMSFEMYLEMECDTCAPFADEVEDLGGLEILIAECKKIDASLF